MTRERPVIGIIDSKDFDVQASFRKGGAEVFSLYDLEDFTSVSDMLDMIVFTGGTDVNPKHYGEGKHPMVWSIDKDRDAFELTAISIAREQGIPMFGICRGAQVLNIAHGGNLHQHIDDLHDDMRSHFSTHHPLILRRKSPLMRVIGHKPMVNSLHHQAVNRLADGFVVEAWSDDGIVEIYRSQYEKGVPFVMGVQFHPEIMQWNNAAMRHLFAWLTARAREYADTTHPRTAYERRETVGKVLADLHWKVPRGGTYQYDPDTGGWTTLDTWDDYAHDEVQAWRRYNESMLKGESHKDKDDIEWWYEHANDDGPSYDELRDEYCAFPPCRYRESCSIEDTTANGCMAEALALQFPDTRRALTDGKGDK